MNPNKPTSSVYIELETKKIRTYLSLPSTPIVHPIIVFLSIKDGEISGIISYFDKPIIVTCIPQLDYHDTKPDMFDIVVHHLVNHRQVQASVGECVGGFAVH